MCSAAYRSRGWEEHRSGILESISPVGHLEGTLAERLALLSWRLHRVARYEPESISISQEKIEEEIHERGRFRRAIFAGSIAEPTHPEDVRGQAEWTKQRHNALKRLPRLRNEQIMKGSGTSGVVHSVLVKAQKIIEADIDEEKLDLPGVEEDEAIEELPPMTAGDVRGCVRAIAKVAGLDSEELLERATYETGCEARGAAYKLEETEREIDRRSREMLLPATPELEKIVRYEAHLSKQLYTVLHELEALQKRWLTGEETPLARLEVHGCYDGG